MSAGWQPIETAPKDGTRILVYAAKLGHDIRPSRHGLHVDFWHDKDIFNFEGWGHFNPQYFPATHWHPLPPNPEGTP